MLTDVEMAQRRAFINFVEGLLNLDPIKRWSPQQAAKHPFITGEKYTGPFEVGRVNPLCVSTNSSSRRPRPQSSAPPRAAVLHRPLPMLPLPQRPLPRSMAGLYRALRLAAANACTRMRRRTTISWLSTSIRLRKHKHRRRPRRLPRAKGPSPATTRSIPSSSSTARGASSASSTLHQRLGTNKWDRLSLPSRTTRVYPAVRRAASNSLSDPTSQPSTRRPTRHPTRTSLDRATARTRSTRWTRFRRR